MHVPELPSAPPARVPLGYWKPSPGETRSRFWKEALEILLILGSLALYLFLFFGALAAFALCLL